MRIEDPALLLRFGQRFRCELCGKVKPGGLDPHHIRARGMGSGWRIDHPANLLAVCRVCHNRIHAGKIPKADLWAIASKRERCDAEAVVNEIARRPKEWKP